MNQLKIDLSQLAQFKESGEDNYLDVLLLGETGTGKELFAKAFDEASGRQGEFVPVNCALIPENLFESQFFGHRKGAFTGATGDSKGYFKKADGGTLFLDEIGELSPLFQSKFLRVIRDRKHQAVGAIKSDKVDVRIVMATNRDIDQMLANGDFRGDFYERINRFPFLIPPLRERKGDIELLVYHFIDKYDTERASNSNLDPIRISKESMKLLKKHDWKRNIGQLENVIARIVVFRLTNEDRETITPDDLPSDILGLGSETQERSEIKEEIPPEIKDFDDKIVFLMKRYGNKSRVAKILGCHYRTVHRHIQDNDLWPPKK